MNPGAAPPRLDAGEPPTRREGFAARIVRWQRRHGRNDLPWQEPIDPYRVWLSEIMLQQTQVATVIPYFLRATRRWPDVRALAAADESEVLALWSGLGYYSRARHLHRCARVVVDAHGGHFPRTAEELQRLPGIGPSTAAAIASICFGERVAILDGNVKRVLARVLAFEGDLANTAALRELLAHATRLLPSAHRADTLRRYTQGLMDLGATVCLPRAPRCETCPAAGDCKARAAGITQAFPRKSRRLTRKRAAWWLLLLRRTDGAVALVRRPERGIWGGLLALPCFESSADAKAFAASWGVAVQAEGEVIHHALTHVDLELHFLSARAAVSLPAGPALAGTALQWIPPDAFEQTPLPTPIARILLNIGP